MQHLPLTTFRRCVARYAGEHNVKRFTCLDQYLCMAFAQLTYRESLRDIETCLRAQATKLYHMGLRGNIARNTLANANATHDWRIYCDFAQRLIGIARCQGEPKFPQVWQSKIPHPVHASASSARTRPAFNFSLSRYELPRIRLLVVEELKSHLSRNQWAENSRSGQHDPDLASISGLRPRE